jgi:NADP-dependent 3-hydroxy acid dehydrogenase YdfG
MSIDHFRGKAVLVTGASAGIGRALASKLMRAGAHVGLVARREERLQALVDELGPSARATILVGDVSDEAFVEQAIAAFAAAAGGVDAVINNAGISMNGLLAETETAVFQRLMDVNYFGSLYFARHALPHLERSRGSLVFVSSIVGKRGFATRSGYAASKFAVHALFESLRVEWADTGIHVGIVAPGYTDTEIRTAALGQDGQPTGDGGHTAGDVMTADEAADAILRATARRRREVILTNGGKLMVWLNKLAPHVADRVAARVVR